MKIALFYLSKVSVGGWVTYTTHLSRAFAKMGHKVELYHVVNRTELTRRRFAEELHYRNVTVERAVEIAKRTPSLIVALSKWYFDRAWPLFPYIKGLVIHDPAELKLNELTERLRDQGVRVIALRKKVLAPVEQKGLRVSLCAHPYVPVVLEQKAKDWHAISISRLDFDKYHHHALQANLLLPPEKQVKLWGAENRIYTTKTLERCCPLWNDFYQGSFSYGEGVVLAARSRFVVDMSEIKGDGGGVQYTFLEAFNAEAVLVISTRWLNPGDSLIHGENCIAVDDAEELAEVLNMEEDFSPLVQGGLKVLEAHLPERVIPAYLKALEADHGGESIHDSRLRNHNVLACRRTGLDVHSAQTQ